MYVDFTNLNAACPKDGNPLRHIDALVNLIVEYFFMSFLDAFSRYHQIQMHPTDAKKTTLILVNDFFVTKSYLLN